MSNPDLRPLPRRTCDFSPHALRWLVFALVFVSVFAAQLLRSGVSPIAWTDTFNDTREVERCIRQDDCTLEGVPSSVPAQSHAAAWLHWRSLWSFLGFESDGTHLTLQILDAAAAVLLLELARRCGGWLAGALALTIYLDLIGDPAIRATALYNTRPLPFLGTVLLVTCTAVAWRPTRRNILLAAFVAALMANVHLACVITGLSVVLVSGTATGFDRKRILLAGVAFTVLAVAMAPPSWMGNLVNLLTRPSGNGPNGGLRLQTTDTLWWTSFALLAWLLSRLSRAPSVLRYRRQVQGAFTITLPFLLACSLAPVFHLDPNPKYLAHLGAAGAFSAALPIALFLRTALSAALDVSQARRLTDTIAIGLVLLVAIRTPIRAWMGVTIDQTPTIRDLRDASETLTARGWGTADLIQRVKALDANAVLTHLSWMHRKRPISTAGSVEEGAILLTLATDEIPDPLPDRWQILHRSTAGATVLIVVQNRLDWSRFEVCISESGVDSPCVASSLTPAIGDSTFLVPRMPWPSPQNPRRLRLRLPLRAESAPRPIEIFLPHLPAVCAGRIRSIDTPDVTVDDDGRRAVIRSSQAGTVEIDWELFAPGCEGNAYDGAPPFFLEGDPATIDTLAEILRRREEAAIRPRPPDHPASIITTSSMVACVEGRNAGRDSRGLRRSSQSFAHRHPIRGRCDAARERDRLMQDIPTAAPSPIGRMAERPHARRPVALAMSTIEVVTLVAAAWIALRELTRNRVDR